MKVIFTLITQVTVLQVLQKILLKVMVIGNPKALRNAKKLQYAVISLGHFLANVYFQTGT